MTLCVLYCEVLDEQKISDHHYVTFLLPIIKIIPTVDLQFDISSHFRSKSVFFHGKIFWQKTFSSTNWFRACAVHHTEAESSWLTWIRVAQTQIACEHVFTEKFRENRFLVFSTVLDEFLLTSVQVWKKNSDLKNLTKSYTLSL
jgi:hypothetical protein